VYDEGDEPKGCCGKHAFNSSLANKLEQALGWQLRLSKQATNMTKDSESTNTSAGRAMNETTGSATGTGYGMFVTADGRFCGVPARARGITSSSAMWDQVRMGWKAGYPALRVLESLIAWRDLAAAGLVENTTTTTTTSSTTAATTIASKLGDKRKKQQKTSVGPGTVEHVPVERVSAELVEDVKNDIAAQLVQPDGTLLTWRSCYQQGGAPSAPSQLPSSSCDRDDPHAANQHSYDLGFVPDHALAVKLGVIPPAVLLKMMPFIRHNSGHRLAIKSFESNNNSGPLIMVDSEKWKYVDADGYAEARNDQTGWSQIFRPPRADGPGNYGNHEQNGGRLFSVSKMVYEATMYPEAVDDWADQVRGSSAIAHALLQASDSGNCTGLAPATLPYPSLVRKPMVAGSMAQAYCKVAYGPTGREEEWGGGVGCVRATMYVRVVHYVHCSTLRCMCMVILYVVCPYHTIPYQGQTWTALARLLAISMAA
jgi:hypothetical protein